MKPILLIFIAYFTISLKNLSTNKAKTMTKAQLREKLEMLFTTSNTENIIGNFGFSTRGPLY
jgi:hypothetical protein